MLHLLHRSALVLAAALVASSDVSWAYAAEESLSPNALSVSVERRASRPVDPTAFASQTPSNATPPKRKRSVIRRVAGVLAGGTLGLAAGGFAGYEILRRG